MLKLSIGDIVINQIPFFQNDHNIGIVVGDDPVGPWIYWSDEKLVRRHVRACVIWENDDWSWI